MKLSARTIIIAIVLSIALFIIGHYSWADIFITILPIVDNVIYIDRSFNGVFINSMLFSLTLASIPVLTILIWKFAPIFDKQRRMLAVCIIVLMMMASVFVRREMIKSQAKNLQPTSVLDYTDPANPQPNTIESSIPVSTLKFEVFALAGLITGSVISFFLLRQKK